MEAFGPGVYCPPEKIIDWEPEATGLDPNDDCLHCIFVYEEEIRQEEAAKAEQERLLVGMGSGFDGDEGQEGPQ